MPLQFDPGEEAQVDWHSGWIIENGIERKAPFFCMRLCYSKASFVFAYEHADLLSFLDGHVIGRQVALQLTAIGIRWLQLIDDAQV